MGKTIGIDLGTCNSCMAVMENGSVRVIPNKEGKNTTPSLVYFDRSGGVIVGEKAKEKYITEPGRVISSIKRHMGENYSIKIDNKDYSPQEISAIILKKLKTDAEEYLKEPVTDAVITVPAYFNDAQRNATKDAGQIAGFNVKRIINEPTAAALAYGITGADRCKVMVYDLGGGTFDVSVLDIDSGVFEVLSTNGDTHLGGNDYTEILKNKIIESLGGIKKIDKSTVQEITRQSEKIKIELSNIDEAKFEIDNNGKTEKLKVARNKFNNYTKGLTDKTIVIMEKSLKEAGVKMSSIDRILLVGGSTKMPIISETISRHFKKEPSKILNPDECVAIGAAIEADKLSGAYNLTLSGNDDITLLDVTPLTLSINLYNGTTQPVVPKNTPIPCKMHDYFSNYDEGTATSFVISQGEGKLVKDNIDMGQFEINYPYSHKRERTFDVNFEIDANGIINVYAIDEGTGKRAGTTLTMSSRMTKKEIEKSQEKILLLN